jgi:hypothetical protein
MSKQRQILKAAAALPPGKARRVLRAIAAKSVSSDKSDPSDLLEQAAAAMQAALEAALLENLDSSFLSSVS